MMKKLKTLGLAAVLATAAPVAAMAATISGQISISGTVALATSNFSAGGNVDLIQGTGQVGAFTQTGDFVGLDGSAVALTDIVFAAPGEIWSVGGFTFTATSFSGIVGGTDPSFTAHGVISSLNALLDDTLGTLEFTTQGNVGNVTFSATTAAIPLPAGGMLLLSGLGGLALVRKRRKSA